MDPRRPVCHLGGTYRGVRGPRARIAQITVTKPMTRRAATAFDPDAELARILKALATSGAVMGRALSKNAVTIDGKIVAFVTRGVLVVKLPSDRIAELVAAGEAEPMRMGARVMREWVSIAPEFGPLWLAFAKESAAFVASAPPAKPRRAPCRR